MAQPSTDNIHGLGVVNNNNNTNGNNNGKDKKGPDSLFGPNVGVISSGPAWTAQTEKKVLKDELTVDVVKNWIEKSKEPSQPTTTLQALVNLKRPTIRLSPLTSSSNDDDPDSHHAQQHGLEFEYDCDAPKCGIYVHVLLPPGHPDAPASTAATGTGTLGVTSATSGADVGVSPDSASPTALSDNNMTSSTTAKPRLAKLLVFESVVDGGFGKVLKIEEGAVLELGRFDGAKAIAKTKPNLASSSSSNSNVIAEGVTSDSNSNIAMNGTTNSTVNSNSNIANNNSRHARRRLTHFFRRHNHHNMSVSGPALAVVDASSASPNDPSVTATNVNGNNDGKDKDKDKDKKAEDLNNGVRVTIRLAALDEQGTELASPNEQVTYLCIERFGVKAPKVTASDSTGQKEGEAGGNEAAEGTAGTGAGASKAEEKEEEEEEDTRPWVVKVVKREATIGPHTFHLHEIYGLTSSSTSSNTHAPTAPLPSQHTYPPLPDQGQAAGEDHESGDTPSECLLCLSSPREVVLLPCRHLVACKDCALNMVEFGAGGTITQGEGDATTGGAAAGSGVGGAGGTGVGGTGTGEAGTGTTTTVAPLQNVNARRKRKAKGWFCPVCRQPYTSLLRITTNPPPVATSATGAPGKSSNEQDREGEEHGDSDPDVDADVDGLDGEEADVTQADPIPSASRTAGENTNAGESGGLPLPVTTNVPGVGAAGQGAASVNNSSSHDVNAAANATATTAATAAAGDGNGAGEETSGASGSTGGGGRFGRPGFLKGLTGRSKSSNGNGNEPRDLESQL